MTRGHGDAGRGDTGTRRRAMAFDVKLTITGLQEAQAKNNRTMAALTPAGAFGRAIQYGTIAAHRGAIVLTHKDTGALKASHRMQIGGLRGRVYIDPGAAKPRSGQRTAEYGPYEHQRGGEHAFYARTVSEFGPEISRAMQGLIEVALW